MNDILIINKDKDGNINHAGFKIDTTGHNFFGNLFKLQKPIFYSSLESEKVGKCSCDLGYLENKCEMNNIENDPYMKLLNLYLNDKKGRKTKRNKMKKHNKTKKKYKN